MAASASLQIVRPPAPIPPSFTSSLFLAGPRGAEGDADSWQAQVLDLLQQAGYGGLVYLPPAGEPTEEQLAWEEKALRHADAILFHLAPGPAGMDPLTRERWGAWRRSGKAVLCASLEQQVLRRAAARLRVPTGLTLAEAVNHLLPLLRPGVPRRGGERAVPLLLWRSPAFQRWYRALRAAGNELDDVEVEWIYRPRASPGRPPLLWALRPRVWVRAERRHKAGEIVVGRAEVSATVLYQPAAQVLDTQVVLIREFRSAGTTADGYVWALPGGSAEHAADREQNAALTALREVQEETGLCLLPSQLEPVAGGARQLASTILSHRAHLFRAALTEEQMRSLQDAERAGRHHGANAGERCYVIIRPLRQLLTGGQLDWGQLGMLLLALGLDLNQ
jgi:8-oxo-dGTP pyrophosphatase MutT (NUDIX family)